MRCLLCQNFSFYAICKRCQIIYCKPNRVSRELSDGFKIYSFYRYKEIEDLLKTKHTHIGAAVYKILAKNSFAHFKREFLFDEKVTAVAIDDYPKSGYSHTAILSRELKCKNIHVHFGALRAKNDVNYSGKTLDYRLHNPRNFIYLPNNLKYVILIDDIVTTGTTFQEAKQTVLKSGQIPLFGLALADASDI